MAGKRIIGRECEYAVVVKDENAPTGYRRVTSLHSNRTDAIAEHVWNWQRILLERADDAFHNRYDAASTEKKKLRQKAWRRAVRDEGAATVRTITEWRAPGE